MPKDDSVISFLQKSPSKGYKTPDVDPLGPHSASLRGSHCPDRPRSPSHDRPRTRDAYSGHHRLSSRSYECYEERVAYSDAPAHRRRPRSRESPPSRHLDFSCRSPSPNHSSSRERFAAGGSSSPERMRFASNGPYQRRSTSRWSPSPPQERFASRRSPSPTQRHVASRRSPSPTQRRVASRQSPSPHGGPRRLLKGASPPRGHPHLSEWDSLQSQDLALPGDPFLGILALQDAPPGTSSLYREVPLRPNEDAMRRETLSPLNSSTHLELRLKSPLKSSTEAYMQDPLITIRVVIFASWRKERTSSESSASG